MKHTMTMTAKDVEQPLLGSSSSMQPANKGRMTLARARAVLMPRRKIIFGMQAACLVFYVIAIFNMFGGEGDKAGAGCELHRHLSKASRKACSWTDNAYCTVSKRTVINGDACEKQRPQVSRNLPPTCRCIACKTAAMC
jgi:hypothetical protein